METQTASQPNVLEQFATLVRQHDITFDYSDDHRAWTQGRDSLDRIMALYNSQNHETKCLMVDVWNKIARLKINPEYVEGYLWKQPKGAA